MIVRPRLALIAIVCLLAPAAFAAPRPAPGNLLADMRQLVATPAVPGYEQELARAIAQRLAAYSPQVDSLGDVVVTLGSGSPRRLLVAPMDEPGYVVSDINAQGYLRLQRLPQFGSLPLFNELYSAQPVELRTAQGKWMAGVIAGPSVHLQPGRQHPPDLNDIENMYVDIGAATAAQARAAGADVLSPLALDRTLYQMGFGKWTAPAIGDRFGDAALLAVLRALDPRKLRGQLTVAFVAQQWTGARGLQRLLQELKPEELIYVGRLSRGPLSRGGMGASMAAPEQKPGSGVLLGQTPPQPASPLTAELTQLARQHNLALAADYSAPLLPRGYLPQPPLPPRWVHLGVATAWASTPAEFLDAHDLDQLVSLLENYLEGEAAPASIPSASPLPEPALPPRPAAAPSPETIVSRLVETYGVSDHEVRVREAIARLLPPWAHPQTDASGNLILHWPAAGHGPRLVVVAHQDEIGYEVHAILPDGHLEVEDKGGGLPPFFLGHAVFVHTADGMRPGVLELPENWAQPNFHWPPETRAATYRLDVGASSPQQVAELGIKTGDFVTIPKTYRRLLGTRANARSFDDRVGCTALIAAAWALGPRLAGNRDVTFVWSTGEELGLVGAAAVAKTMAAEGRAPDYVFAVDTFVSSDSPLESTRFGDAKLGAGFVVRAVDNSNLVPRKLVDKVLALARAQGIAAQYGVTGGGNDGSAFLRYGSTDVALGWPLRYSHSPGEVVDTRDVDALARIVAAVARQW
jgi:putative aminopeptidase FrvX